MLSGNQRWRAVWLAAFTAVCSMWHAVEYFFEPWLTLAGM